MTYLILVNTPHWVWVMLLVLLSLGLTQTTHRRASLRRVIVLPLVMTALSLYGTFSVFGQTYWNWVLWAGAALATVAWFASSDLPAGVGYDANARVFSLPGSWVPLGLMMAIFATRYTVGVVLGLHPALTQDPGVAAIVASIYGALSGVFIGRLVCLLRFIRAGRPTQPEATTVAWG